MEIFLILLCIGLVLGGVAVVRTVIVKRKRRNNNPSTTPSPPPLPSRIRAEEFADRHAREFHPNAVPPRISYSSESSETSGEGPRGIKPNQFPCCPYDKQRNVLGGPKVIFWDSESNCYCCSRGHQFRQNGKPL